MVCYVANLKDAGIFPRVLGESSTTGDIVCVGILGMVIGLASVIWAVWARRWDLLSVTLCILREHRLWGQADLHLNRGSVPVQGDSCNITAPAASHRKGVLPSRVTAHLQVYMLAVSHVCDNRQSWRVLVASAPCGIVSSGGLTCARSHLYTCL